MSRSDERSEDDQPPVTVRDKRRVDPETGEVREPVAVEPDAEEPAEVDSGSAALEAAAAELTADLQRVSAEYANYRKRVDRDRLAAHEQATAAALSALFGVLDDIGRAREHGDLEGTFKSVGEAVEAVVAKLGLVTFGTVGEPFDPTVHEALMQAESAEVTEPSVAQVWAPGYRLGERILRPARVQVAVPAETPSGEQ